MKSDARWMTILAGRVLANALVGGITFAFVGALCVGLAGGIIGIALDGWSRTFSPAAGYGFFGAFIGAKVGAFDGIVGVFLFAIATIRAKPGRLLKPFSALIGRVITGQITGTMGALTSFMIFEFVKTLIISRGFSQNVFDDLLWILFGTPILMICGAIAGALTKRDLPKVATLNAE